MENSQRFNSQTSQNMAELMVSAPGKATAKSGIINLMNTILGAGLLSISYAIRADGLTLGVILVFICACTSAFGLYCLAISATFAIPGHASFFALSKLTVPQLGILFDLAIAVKCFGVGCSYLIVIGDLMPQIVQSTFNDEYLETHDYWLSRTLWISVFLILILPLVYKRHLDSLKTASLIALSSVGYLVILVVVHFIHTLFGGTEDIDKGPIHFLTPHSLTTVLSAFPILVFGFTCHQNQFTVINELEDRSQATINRIITTAIGTAFVLYLATGVTGYLTFGDNVAGNIITMYPDSVTTTIGRVAIVILVALSYPLQSNPARASINHVAFYVNDSKVARSIRSLSRSASRSLSRSASTTTQSSSAFSVDERRSLLGLRQLAQLQSQSAGNSANEIPFIDDSMVVGGEIEESGAGEQYVELTNMKLVVITTLIVILSYLISISVKSLAHVLAIVGATGSTSISFILPGFFAFKLLGSDGGELSMKDKITKYAALALVVWGVAVMILCLSATLFLGA